VSPSPLYLHTLWLNHSYSCLHIRYKFSDLYFGEFLEIAKQGQNYIPAKKTAIRYESAIWWYAQINMENILDYACVINNCYYLLVYLPNCIYVVFAHSLSYVSYKTRMRLITFCYWRFLYKQNCPRRNEYNIQKMFLNLLATIKSLFFGFHPSRLEHHWWHFVWCRKFGT
jgi:hypothetical protein